MEFTHLNESGRARMVDVGGKDDTNREATARARIKMNRDTISMIRDCQMKKGDVLSVAQVGGIMGAKRTSDIIPMCHNIFISGVDIEFKLHEEEIEISAVAKTRGKTGIEMEALTAVSVAALTIYDMCKAVDKGMVISDIMLIKKTGGKSGDYERESI